MNIIIRNSSRKPIYEQIKDQIKAEIISGKVVSGEKLPSMRHLAKELRISVITTKRAYDELERKALWFPFRVKEAMLLHKMKKC